jgi:hypothetical protein
LQEKTGLSDLEILSLSPRQTQIKLFEIQERELASAVNEYIKAGGKADRLDGELWRKYQEMQGVRTEDLSFENDQRGLTEMDKKYLAKLRENPNATIKDVLTK